MGLREVAEADLGVILEDDVTGFGWAISVQDPSGNLESFKGFSDDIAQVIDPDTGQIVSGRIASVALRMSSLKAVGMRWPVGVADTTGKPWTVRFEDILGSPHCFKVAKSNPDRTIGLLTCILEKYRD